MVVVALPKGVEVGGLWTRGLRRMKAVSRMRERAGLMCGGTIVLETLISTDFCLFHSTVGESVAPGYAALPVIAHCTTAP